MVSESEPKRAAHRPYDACQEDDTGRVDYVRAAPKLAAMIYALIDAQGQEQRIEAINELGKRMEDVGVRK